jgi:hypothetical protein
MDIANKCNRTKTKFYPHELRKAKKTNHPPKKSGALLLLYGLEFLKHLENHWRVYVVCTIIRGGVSHCGLAIYIKNYLKAKEE